MAPEVIIVTHIFPAVSDFLRSDIEAIQNIRLFSSQAHQEDQSQQSYPIPKQEYVDNNK